MIRLKVLIVDDSAPEAERTVDELCRGGYTPTWERVCTREETESALSGDPFDLVLSDYLMEGFSALEALSLVRDHDPDMPFLIFSEELGEETAIRAIKAGAHNCVEKSSIGRLCPAVERELREAQIRRERRLARRALRESENRFRTLAETASDAILTVGDDGRILYVNRAAEPIFGHPASSLIGEPLSMLLPGHAYGGPNAPAVWKATSTGQAIAVTGRRADGSDVPLEVSFGEWLRDGRRLLTVIARDASVLRSAEQSLRESESRLRQLFERNLAGLYRFTLDGRMLDCNPAFARIFGYESREEVLGVHAVDFYLSPEDRQESLRRLGEQRSLANYEQRLRRRDGRVVWVLENESLVEGPEPGTLVIEGTLVDITERKRAEEEREASLSLLRATLEATADGLLVVDRQGFIVTYNQRLVDMWRFPSGAIETRDHSVAMQAAAHELEDPGTVLGSSNRSTPLRTPRATTSCGSTTAGSSSARPARRGSEAFRSGASGAFATSRRRAERKRPFAIPRTGIARSSSATSPASTARPSTAACSTATTPSPASSGIPRARRSSDAPPGTST